jgi:hypothetical protein
MSDKTLTGKTSKDADKFVNDAATSFDSKEYEAMRKEAYNDEQARRKNDRAVNGKY